MWVVLFVLSAVSAQVTNNCLATSVGPPYVHNIVGDPTNSPLAVANMTPQQGISLIWPTVLTVTSPYFIDLYYGLSTGDTFNIKSCQGYEALYYAYYCGLGISSPAYTPYVAYVTSQTNFGDIHRHVFPLSATGQLGTQVGVESANYVTPLRPWYTEGISMPIGTSGWTNIVISLTTGLANHVFVEPFQNAAGTVFGVAAYDRSFREPCDPCTMNSEAIPTVSYLANSDMTTLCLGVKDLQGVGACFSALFQAYKVGNRGRNNGVAVGLDNGDFYELNNCLLVEYNATCILGGMTGGYLMSVNNKLIFADNVNRIYPMDVDGTIHFENELHVRVGLTTAYNPRVRPWYLTGTGFSDPFVNVGTTTYTSTSYNLGFIGPAAAYGIGNSSYIQGVVSSTISSLEPCQGYIAPPPC